jgi:hypothetical protein
MADDRAGAHVQNPMADDDDPGPAAWLKRGYVKLMRPLALPWVRALHREQARSAELAAALQDVATAESIIAKADGRRRRHLALADSMPRRHSQP